MSNQGFCWNVNWHSPTDRVSFHQMASSYSALAFRSLYKLAFHAATLLQALCQWDHFIFSKVVRHWSKNGNIAKLRRHLVSWLDLMCLQDACCMHIITRFAVALKILNPSYMWCQFEEPRHIGVLVQMSAPPSVLLITRWLALINLS